jgi:hypothetical protein
MRLKTLFFLFLAGVLSQSVNLPALAADDAAPCTANSDARQLDYWLGEWSVASPGMAGKGQSNVHLSLDQCMMVESWGSDTSDHRGENSFAYNSEDKAWYGLFVDNHGRVHSMKGNVTPGYAEFVGPARDDNGKAILKKVKVVRQNADAVEQVWERSVDNGASWTTDFKMEYAHKKL